MEPRITQSHTDAVTMTSRNESTPEPVRLAVRRQIGTRLLAQGVDPVYEPGRRETE